MRYLWIVGLVGALVWAQEEGRIRRRERTEERKEAAPRPSVQTVVIKGRIIGGDGEPLPGAYVKVKGTIQGNVADVEGNFQVVLLAPLDPVELEVSFVGYEPQMISVPLSEAQKGLTVTLKETGVQAQEVVISASRVPEAVMQSPVTVLRMSAREVVEAPGVSLFQNITFLKSAEQVSSSLTFQIVNTRGFNSTGNTRFVQRLDGIEMQAPILNFPVGALTNAADLDVASVEFTPGPSSALYGPNAFNGILNIYTKDPFQYPGLSASVRLGVNHLDHIDTTPQPLYDIALRYAKSWNNRFGLKVFANVFDAHDWVAGDATDHGVYAGAIGRYAVPGPQNPGYDAVNLYGDEARIEPATVRGIAMTLGRGLGGGLPQDTNDLGFYLARTGYWEREILQYNARALKGSIGAYYRLTDRLQLDYQAFASTGATVYQGANRYSIREFLFTAHKLELTGPEYKVWAYGVWENSGNSFDSRFAALNLLNKAKTHNAWMVQYVLAYTGQLRQIAQNALGLDPDLLGIPVSGDHAAARAYADSDRANAIAQAMEQAGFPPDITRLFQGEARPAPGSARFNELKRGVIAQSNFAGGGAKFIDRSSFYHIEGQYDFSKRIRLVQLLLGGNFRYYLINSQGTICSDTAGPIGVWEGGAFAQVSKAFWTERVRLLGSLRYDKNVNFQGRFTPRIATIVALDKAKNHNLRISYQTGFRMPTLQAQYNDLDVGPFKLIGGLRPSDEYYGIIGNNYSRESVDAFLDSLKAQTRGTTNPGAYADLLRTLPIENVKPERVAAFEIGIRHLLWNKLYIDIDYAYSRFTDFMGMGSIDLVGPLRRVQSDGTVAIDRLTPDSIANGAYINYRRYYNTPSVVFTHHVAMAVQYTISRQFFINSNFTYAEIKLSEEAKQIAQFNTPKYRVNASLTGRELTRNKRWGFVVGYRWVNAYLFEEPFHQRIIPTYQLVDLQVSYKIPKWRSMIRVGGQNILNNRHIEVPGGPTLGSLYYLQFVYDPFLP